MCKSSSFVGGRGIDIVKKEDSMSKVKNVHIGVFFDGTNNNAVQQAIFNSYKEKKNLESLKDNERKEYDEIITKKEKLKELKIQAMLYSSQSFTYGINTIDYEELQKKYDEIREIEKELESFNFKPQFNISNMASYKSKGFSNISILYSLLQTRKGKGFDLYYNIYVEGSGATDISRTSKSNINGLGFGLGQTGVTALVSKALKNITDWLQSMKIYFNENTAYHFYVFGFSRGATCARVFTELTTRDKGEKLNREFEFAQNTSHVAHLMQDGRIPFMEQQYFGGNPIIKRENVTVDFLGIYDTVASIGFLKQKDGWTNALSLAYRWEWWNNYHGNYHYMNVHDYGLFSHHNSRVKYTYHICAGDEFRENFALVNLGRTIPENSMEVVIPGCHSDIGGGYVNGVGMDIVLYKFIPRKIERFLKSSKLTEMLGFQYLKSKERAKMFLTNPSNKNGEKKELSKEVLAKLGWIGKEWSNNTVDIQPELSYDNEVCTKRVADWPNEIKFKRYAMRGYSNIPLLMMKKCVENCGITWLFIQKTYPYEIPQNLKDIGNKMLNTVVIPSGKRLWLIPGGSYSGEKYRKLRLNYLHFTSSCELMHFRTNVDESKRTKNKDIPKDAIEGSEKAILDLYL